MEKPEKVYSYNYMPEIVGGMEKEKQLAQAIAKTINGSFLELEFCKAMMQEHEYLQYEFTMLCLAWLNAYGNLKYNDNKNINTSRMVRKIMEELS